MLIWQDGLERRWRGKRSGADINSEREEKQEERAINAKLKRDHLVVERWLSGYKHLQKISVQFPASKQQLTTILSCSSW